MGCVSNLFGGGPSGPPIIAAKPTAGGGKELAPLTKKKRKYFGEAQRDLGPLSLAKGGVLGPSESMFG